MLGYGLWVVTVALWLEPAAARLQALVTVAGPALAAAGPVALALLVRGLVRAPTREDRLAVRLALLALVGALGVRLLLVDVPDRLSGSPLLPWEVLSLLLAPAVLSCVAAALLRYRLEEIEPTVRRTLVQAAVATVVGVAFVAVVGAVNLASDTSFESMVAGGAVALLLLPLAVALNRFIRRLVYGDPAAAQQVVAELRSLDPLTAPTEALRETLTLLARRLRLSWAAIEVFGERPDDRVATSIGEPGGTPTVIDLVVGGSPVGRLELAAAADRDPFGPADRRLLEDVGAQVGALVQAVGINRDLQRSRRGIVTAREEERLRVRRDLHDGLGPSLATLAMRLEAARELIAEDPAKAEDLVGQLAEQAREEIAEVRRLVHGLRPPALDQLGLVSALRQRADEHNLAGVAAPPGHDVGARHRRRPRTAARGGGGRGVPDRRRGGEQRRPPQRFRLLPCGAAPRRRRTPPRGARHRCRDGGRRHRRRARLDERAGPRARRQVLRDIRCGGRHAGRGDPAAGGGAHGGRRQLMDRLRVLVVDDHEPFRAGLEAMLAAAGTLDVVGSVADGREAVDLALELQPDVILMDLHMPRLNGIEATARIVQSSPHISVVVLTMMEDEDSVFAAVRAGARGYLLKGARRGEILRAVEAVGAGEVIFGPGIADRMMTFFRGVPARPSADVFPQLTERERVVLGLIAGGLENAAIARELGLSVKTVRNHASNIFAKLQVAHRAQAIILAREAGLE